jgi:hypothetical protein
MNDKPKWVMVSYSEFTKSDPPYFVTVTPRFSKNWAWVISDENNKVIDCAMYHNNIPTSELDAKAKADKVLESLKNKSI